MKCTDRIKTGLLVLAIGVAVICERLPDTPAPIRWHSDTQGHVGSAPARLG